mgnify:CR=1 FL=1
MVSQKFGRQPSKSPKNYVKINQNLDRIPVPTKGIKQFVSTSTPKALSKGTKAQRGKVDLDLGYQYKKQKEQAVDLDRRDIILESALSTRAHDDRASHTPVPVIESRLAKEFVAHLPPKLDKSVTRLEKYSTAMNPKQIYNTFLTKTVNKYPFGHKPHTLKTYIDGKTP